MPLHPEVFYMINKMYEYQKKNNTTEMCVTNCTFLRDNLIEYGYKSNDVKAKPVIALWANDISKISVCCIHMVIECNGHILDPSYEVHSEKATYFNTVGLVLPLLKKHNDYSTFDIKDLISGFIRFIELAKRINKGELIVTDKEYYNSQADYILN